MIPVPASPDPIPEPVFDPHTEIANILRAMAIRLRATERRVEDLEHWISQARLSWETLNAPVPPWETR